MRIKGWEKAFWAHVARYRLEPFVWGTHDCALFAARGVDAIRGTSTAAEVYRDYTVTSAADYLRVIREHGSLSEMVANQFGEIVGPSVPVGWCSIGDVLILSHEGREILGLHEGHHAIAPGPTKLEVLPLDIAVSGWKV